MTSLCAAGIFLTMEDAKPLDFFYLVFSKTFFCFSLTQRFRSIVWICHLCDDKKDQKKHQTALCYEAMGDKLLNLRIQGQHKKIQAILCVCTGVKYCVARVTL